MFLHAIVVKKSFVPIVLLWLFLWFMILFSFILQIARQPKRFRTAFFKLWLLWFLLILPVSTEIILERFLSLARQRAILKGFLGSYCYMFEKPRRRNGFFFKKQQGPEKLNRSLGSVCID